jgi:hypothetical protein
MKNNEPRGRGAETDANECERGRLTPPQMRVALKLGNFIRVQPPKAFGGR